MTKIYDSSPRYFIVNNYSVKHFTELNIDALFFIINMSSTYNTKKNNKTILFTSSIWIILLLDVCFNSRMNFQTLHIFLKLLECPKPLVCVTIYRSSIKSPFRMLVLIFICLIFYLWYKVISAIIVMDLSIGFIKNSSHYK